MWNYWVITLVSMGVTVFCQDCNFDSNGTLTEKRCRWEIRLSSGGYNWLHTTGPTPHPRTGPLTDYSGNGGYVYAPGGEVQDDGSITQWRKGSRTHLVSPVVHTERTPKLVRFYYYMYGSDVGILNVFIIVKGRKTPKPQWRKTGDKGNLWKLGEVTIPSNSTARVIFEAVPTRNVAGDIAIDEITFTDMAIDCDFEGEVSHPSCNFIQATDDQFDWMPNAGKTPTKKTGPPVDHTRGTSKGVYMYLESTGVEEGDTCVIITTRFQKEVAPCTLNFFYYMQGNHVGSLYVHLVTEPGVLGTTIWSRNGAHGGTWRGANVDLTNVTGPYSIAFKGVRGDGANGDIAIDDIKLLGQDCLNEDVMPALEAGDTYWDYCDSSPCTNNGTCVTRAGDYACLCPEAWTGKSCETEVPEGPCRSQPCMNDGICNQTESNGTFSYTCVCPEPYDGDMCEIDLDAPYCDSQPCLNGARCKLTATGYQCLCLDGWNGTRCQNDIDECSLDICQNGGNCTNTDGGFSCECPVEWHGPTCADECVDENTHCAFWAGVDECRINPKYMLVYCKRSCAVCGDYECVDNDVSCPIWAETGECGKNPFYMLAHCHLSCEVCVDDQCRSSPCWNGGTCIDGEDSYTCECADGYYGSNCQNNTDECASNPCQNGATCLDGINGFTCNCTEMYEGTFCEHRKDHCSSGPCQNNGNCTNTEEGFTCTCQPGFEGDNCEINIDECASSPCENDGVCIDKDNGFLCNCTEAWVGVNCDLDFDECKSNPCQNGGLCYHGIGESLYFCDCLNGWTGEDCTEEIDECESTPCQNGGTCVDELDSYACTCAVGYTGLSCEAELLECASDPCMNDGQCVENVGSFDCLCPEGFLGYRCQYEVNECQSAPCVNGGTCLDLPRRHLCVCPGGYSGRYCETVIPSESAPTSDTDYSSEFRESYDFYRISEKWNYEYSYDPDSAERESESYLNPVNVPTTVKDTSTVKRLTPLVSAFEQTTMTMTTKLTTITTQPPPPTTQPTTPLPLTSTASTRMPPTTTATTTVTTTRTVTPSAQTTRNQVRTTTPPSTSSPTTTLQRTTTIMKDSEESTPRKPTKESSNTLPPKTGDGMTSVNNRINPNASSKRQPNSLNMITIVIVAIIAFILLVLIVIVVVAYRRYQQSRTRIYEQFDMESKEDRDFGAQNDDFEPEMADPTESNSFKYSPM